MDEKISWKLLGGGICFEIRKRVINFFSAINLAAIKFASKPINSTSAAYYLADLLRRIPSSKKNPGPFAAYYKYKLCILFRRLTLELQQKQNLIETLGLNSELESISCFRLAQALCKPDTICILIRINAN